MEIWWAQSGAHNERKKLQKRALLEPHVLFGDMSCTVLDWPRSLSNISSIEGPWINI